MESRTISHYRIIEKLGAGGMGEVYLAEDKKLGRKVALKLLAQEFTANRDRLNRFEQEACAASSLNHPNILTIYEVGEDAGTHFMATEYIYGITLRHRLQNSSLETVEILDIAVQIASALDEAHSAGIVHRDIKPENIMIRRNGFVKLLDFGLAKLTEKTIDRSSLDAEASTRVFVQTDVGVVMGTSHYMSPEQTRANELDARTDLWSLGVVMYEMSAGRAPFAGESSTDVIVAITQKEPQPLARFSNDVPAEFEWIITKALRKDRDERYQTAKELLTDLRKLKQRLEFEAELERSTSPEKSRNTTTISDQRTLVTEISPSVPTNQAVSSAEYIVSEIKRRKKSAAVVAGLFVLAVMAGVLFYFNRANALTDKDTILIADFANSTGEAVFDGTLKQALAVQLGQTPFLNIFPDERVKQTLRFMGRSPDERITKDIGREICERQGIKALLVGSISSLGSNYVITLEALNAQTGETIARDQVEAQNKEGVLSALSDSASRLREKLGESLSSIKKYDVKIDQATTSSLEALKAYANGNEQRAMGNPTGALPFYLRAIELDQNFAMAHARLAVHYGNNSEFDKAQVAAQRAYELRDRVSDHERFYISEKYHNYVTGDLDKAIEVLQAWAKTYPNDFIPHNNLSNNYGHLGLYDQALKEALEAVRLDPRSITARGNVINSFMKLGRWDEARQAIDELRALAPESEAAHFTTYILAFLRNDQAAMQKELELVRGKPMEADMLNLEASIAAHGGRLRHGEELAQQSQELFKRQERIENVAQLMEGVALTQALVGRCKDAQTTAASGLSMSPGRVGLTTGGLVYAVCGNSSRSLAIADEITKKYPTDTASAVVTVPMIRAETNRTRGNAAEALRTLETIRRYDLGNITGFLSNYLRGLAYLDQRSGNEAAAEFQKILDRPGIDPTSVIIPLAHLGIARAAVLSGDQSRARKEYQDFFALWKDADKDLPVLLAARKEYEQLQ